MESYPSNLQTWQKVIDTIIAFMLSKNGTMFQKDSRRTLARTASNVLQRPIEDLPVSDIKLRQVRYFLCLAECTNFRRAAEILHISQPGLSQQILQFEAEVGVRFFERTNRHVQLTPAGVAFRIRAQSMLHGIAEAIAEARSIEAGEGGRIIVGYEATEAMAVLPGILAPFCSRFPRIVSELRELDPAALVQELLQNRIDVAFTRVPISLPSVECTTVGREKLMVALPKRHRAAKHKSVDFRHLSNDRILLPPSHMLYGVRERIIGRCQQHGFILECPPSISLAETAVWLVARGFGVALVPESLLGWNVDGVVYRPLKQNNFVIRLYAIRRKGETSAILDRLWRHFRARQEKSQIVMSLRLRESFGGSSVSRSVRRTPVRPSFI